MAKKTTDSTKRYGTRYGKRLRAKAAVVEREQRRKHKCPSCNNLAVKRVSPGIWLCRKCNLKFASRCYTVAKPQKKTVEA